MSAGEAGVMSSRDAYGGSGGLHHSGQPQPVIQNMRVAYGTDGGTVYKPLMSMSPSYQGSSGNGGHVDSSVGHHNGINMNMDMGLGEERMKRKRGRPRKYGPDEGMLFAALPPIQAVPVATQSPAVFSSPQSAPVPLPLSGPVSPTNVKKRGRPRGSVNKKKKESRGPAGVGFIPHIITVKAGEDVSAKILSFSQHSSRAVCILSASGAISNVTLRQPATSGGTVTCEGRFEILSLSGSFFLTENDGQRMRSGGLNVSLSGPDGRVMGGGVAGLLIAASPVQVILGSFNADGGKESKTPRQKEPVSSLHNEPLAGGGNTGGGSSPSGGSLSESSGGGSGSPLNQSMGILNNNSIPQGMPWK
uniref:AT-hook motif nuclear-localized protein n=1 Tax=Kalanchoe fedtschenkoi TaxID=63787 RepID=A0A7N1A4Q4_KALFE